MKDNELVSYETAQALVNCAVWNKLWLAKYGLDPVPHPNGGYVKPPVGPIPYLPPRPCVQ
jgi:hypothetical protein